MKKTSAVIGTLAVAGSLIASTAAIADTSTTSVSATAPRLIDKIVASYWGAYSGPSVLEPSARTYDTDSVGALNDLQSLDSTLTLGYKLADNVTINGNYRFILRPMLDDTLVNDDGKPAITDHFTQKDPWLSLKHSKLISKGPFNLSADLRLYVPVATSGKMNTAIRSTQIATLEVPNTRLTLGTYTLGRANSLRGNSSMDNFEIYGSAFANYQMTSTLAATAWTDLVQWDIFTGDTGKDLHNKPVDVAVGVNWDVTPKFSVNPQLTVFPGHLTLDRTTIGAIISAKVL